MFDSFKVIRRNMFQRFISIQMFFFPFQDSSFLSMSEKTDRETLNTIERSYFNEEDFNPEFYELEVRREQTFQ